LDTMLIRERYKVVRVLEAQEYYAFMEAVDIQDRENNTCLLNVYEGPLLRRYLDCFEQMSDCPGFQRIFLAGESLVAVFDECLGRTIDEVFYLGAEHNWKTRLVYTELLLHKALSLANLPPLVSCAAFLSENVFVDLPGDRVRLRYRVRPMEDMNRRELALLAGDQVKKILLGGFSAPEEELVFLNRLDDGSFESVVQLYSLWHAEREKLQTAYEEREERNPVSRTFCDLGRAIRRKARKRR